jgi:hypothetical protein
MALAFELAGRQVEQPELLGEVPDGATLVLIPDDDPELAAFNVEVGLNAIRSGQNVYFRHVSRNVAAGPT